MKLLKDGRAYRRWSTGKDGWDTYKDRWRNAAPSEYPCYAYTEVTDCGMEESSPRYLYFADVSVMWEALWAERG